MVTSSSGILTVLYDADCGICTATARVLVRLDRRGRLNLVPLQTAPTANAPSLGDLLASLHAVDEQGRWWVGPDAVLQITQRVPVLRPVTIFARLPLVPKALDAAYRTVANHRQQLSRMLGLDACGIESATSAGRSEEPAAR
jgi:predicted DCC family thiol-disulfide oxidoreductase YuxK